MNKPTQIVFFYAKENNWTQNLLHILKVFNLKVEYRNRYGIGFTHPKLGLFEIIFRDLCATNDTLYKYVLKGTKTFYLKAPFVKDDNLKILKKKNDDYFYICYHNGEKLNLPVYVIQNLYEFIDIAFSDYKTLYYEPIFEDNLFKNEYKENYYSIVPSNVNAFESKEEAKAFALEKMKKDVEWYRTRIGNKRRTILAYQREIAEYEQEIEDLEKKISFIQNECNN